MKLHTLTDINNLQDDDIYILYTCSFISHLHVHPDVQDGKYSVLFTSPESITKPFWRKMLLETTYTEQLCLLCFDEAHCISEW